MGSPATPTEAVRPPGRRFDPQRLLVALVALVALALLKPWVLLEPALPAAPPPLASRLPSPDLATPTPSPSPLRGVSCHVPDTWRLVTLARTGARLVTTWVVVQPRLGGGAGDADLPVAAIPGDALVGLGVCAPGGAGGSVELVGLWQVTPDGGGVEPRSAAPATDLPVEPATDLARLYLPGAAAGWPAGRYVLALRWPPGSNGPAYYLAVEVAPPG